MLPLTLSTTQCLLHWIERTPEAVAVIEHGHPYSYGDLGVSVVQYVQALRTNAATQGMLVGIACENRYLHLVLLLAAEIVGATAVSFSKADVLSSDPVLARCDLLCLEDGLTTAVAARVMSVGQEAIDRIARTPVSRGDFALLDCCPGDDAVVILTRTSGSTGRPKALAMTHALMRDLTAKTARFPDDPGYA
jgi:acyl-CoA synthetase (AMP-forming)/AMP-acid ligase II